MPATANTTEGSLPAISSSSDDAGPWLARFLVAHVSLRAGARLNRWQCPAMARPTRRPSARHTHAPTRMLTQAKSSVTKSFALSFQNECELVSVRSVCFTWRLELARAEVLYFCASSKCAFGLSIALCTVSLMSQGHSLQCSRKTDHTHCNTHEPRYCLVSWSEILDVASTQDRTSLGRARSPRPQSRRDPPRLTTGRIDST